jgi:hypothetical protein
MNFSTDGKFNLFRGKNGQFFLVNPAWLEWQRSEHIRPGKNKITWIIHHGHFEVLCNDHSMYEFTDDSLDSGGILLAVGRDGCAWRFSDFSLRPLD